MTVSCVMTGMKTRFRPALLYTCLVSGLASVAAQAEPATGPRASATRLAGLSQQELSYLFPHTARGPVALVEFADTAAGELPGINVVTRVKAPVTRLLKVLKDPAAYPRFMGTLDHVEVLSRKGSALVYDWSWDLSLFRLRGRNVMRVYEAPRGNARGGHRVTIDCLSGDLGTGRMLIRLLPHGDNASLMVLSLRLDLRNANYVARRAARAARSINRSASMALAYAMGFSLAHEAERVHRAAVPTADNAVAIAPPIDVPGLLPLLRRGDLLLLEMNGSALQRVAVLGRIHQPRSLVREIMLDAKSFGAALVPGSKAEVVAQRGDLTTFDWAIDLPLIGVSGRMKLRKGDPEIRISATSGALAGGRWSIETTALDKAVTLVSGSAAFDIRKSNLLLRALANADRYLAHGMTAASELMLLRALRKRARDLAGRRKAN